MFLGVDVGGTNTDAVVLDGSRIIGSCKAPTSEDVTQGVVAAIKGVMDAAALDPNSIEQVTIGTTHFVNAIVQRRNLCPIALLRISSESCRSIPPYADFPEDLKELVELYTKSVSGGFQFDGSPISAFSADEIRAACREIQKLPKEPGAVAISCAFSPVQPEHEIEARKIVQEELPHIPVSISSEIGHLNLLQRENATILNSCLLPLAEKTVQAFQQSLKQLGLHAKLFLTQNDGTVMNAEKALRLPVLTFGSGPTNSMRGAAFLAGHLQRDAVVVDIGGTTTDVGLLLSSGFPREASLQVEVGGVITNFRMPDVLSIGLGGGSIVNGEQIGPISVGYELSKKARVFNGEVLTASDIAVAAGQVVMGDPSKVKDLKPDYVEHCIQKMKSMVEIAIDRIKTKKEDVLVILVGGGSVLVEGNLKGSSSVLRPAHFAVANAVGAAICQISGDVDKLVSLASLTREEVVASAKKEAIQKAIDNGAVAETVKIVEASDMQLAYIPGNVIRVQARAIGDFKAMGKSEPVYTHESSHSAVAVAVESHDYAENIVETEQAKLKAPKTFAYLPTFNTANEWELSEYDLQCIAIGAGILGCGGGGNTYNGTLRAISQIRQQKRIRVISPKHLKEDAVLFPCGFIGAPGIMLEKFSRGDEIKNCINAVEKRINQKASAVMSVEIGGTNAIEPLVAAAVLDIPALDGDGMGRAFPELHMYMPIVFGCSYDPLVMCDDKGHTELFTEIATAKDLEIKCRETVIAMGCAAGIALPPLSVERVNQGVIHNTLSQCFSLGKNVLEARATKSSPVESILKSQGGTLLFRGKTVDVQRAVTDGFMKGKIIVEGFDSFVNQTMEVDFQNENLIARVDGKVVASVPDLIAILDSETGSPIFTEDSRFGLRVDVIGIRCSPLLNTPEALAQVGPQAFHYDIAFTPLDAEYVRPKSVWEQYTSLAN